MTLRTHKNNILFRFLDPVNSKGEFVRQDTSFGLALLPGFDNSAKQPRWCEVLSVGPEVKDVAIGDWILLPALRWTERVEYEGSKFWKTNEEQVVVVRKGGPTGVSLTLNNFVLFTPSAPPQQTTASGLIVVGAISDETASGVVFSTGPDAEQELLNATVYYDGDKFFERVEDRVDVPFAFIKEDNVLLYKPAE